MSQHGKPMGRLFIDLWDYDYVDTQEGGHYRVLDHNGNYRGSYHNESSAARAAWENNVKVALSQGRVVKNRYNNALFILTEGCMGKLPGMNSPLVPGVVLRNNEGILIWIDQERFDDEYRVQNA